MTAENGAIEIARMLLDAGADPNIHDKLRRIPSERNWSAVPQKADRS
jgi:ankyrin repeat protein